MSVSSALWGAGQKTTREFRKREVNTQTYSNLPKECITFIVCFKTNEIVLCVSECSNGVDNNSGQCDAAALAPPPSSVDGSLLINCYLQGLRVWQMTRHSTGEVSLKKEKIKSPTITLIVQSHIFLHCRPRILYLPSDAQQLTQG